MSIIEFSVKRRIAITMFTLIVALFGLLAFRDLGIDLFPELEFPVVTIITTYTSVGSEEIETGITRPIEEFVGSVSGVRQIDSSSSEGLSIIRIEFEWGVNIDAAAQDVREKLSWVSEYLPKDAATPMVLKSDISNMPVIQYGVTGMGNTLQLREFLRTSVKTKLERLDGVSQVWLYGGKEREIQILIDPIKMRATDCSLEQIKKAILFSNWSMSGGHINIDQKEYLIRTSGYFNNINEMRGIVVNATKQGQIVHLSDVAEIRDGFKEIRGQERTNRQPTVIIGVMKQSGANTVRTAEGVLEKMKEIEKTVPSGVKFFLIYNQGKIIKNSISNTGKDALMGGIIAIFVVFIFLKSVRATLAIALAIPLSIVTTFIGMNWLGYTFNIMTLGGLTLAVGLVVDDAIVVIENTFRHLEQGKPRDKAAIDGAKEVILAVSASTFTTMAVFIPLSLAKNIAGKLARPLSFTVCLALGASLVVAFTVIPAIAASLFKKEKEVYENIEEKGWIKKMNDKYSELLTIALNHKRRVVGGAFGLLLISIGLTYLLGAEFMPKQDYSISSMHITLPEGSLLSETNHIVEQVENLFLARPEVLGVVSIVGQTQGSKFEQDSGTNKGTIWIRFKEKDDRKKGMDIIVNEVRTLFPKLKDVDYRFEDVVGNLMGGDSSPITVDIAGPDLDVLDKLSNEIMQKLTVVPGLKDLKKSLKKRKPELHIEVDREEAARLGIYVYQIADAVQTAMQGTTVSFFREGGKEYDIKVKFNEEGSNSFKALENIYLQSPVASQAAASYPGAGISTMIPLSQVTKTVKTYGPISIARKNQERVVTIGATNFKRDIAGITKDIQAILSKIKMDQGYSYTISGQYEQMQKSFRELSLAFMVAVLLIYMIMAAQFESLSQPFVVMFTMPLAYIGVVLGLLVTGNNLSVPSLMGLIILMGIVVKNGIVMIDYINQLRLRGVEKTQAIIQGASIRLRPVLMTSLTAIVGMLPMAFSGGEGSETSSPMALAVSFGLFVSTLLTLFVIPSIYYVVEDYTPKIRHWINRKLFGEEDFMGHEDRIHR
jgi:hydrophobic/amphiphilic exporter-1 (mainly G- bacteria), HAE1 family